MWHDQKQMIPNSRQRPLATVLLATILCSLAAAFGELPQRWPASVTEFFLVSWMPELREFEPPRGSPEAELLAIAQLVQHGRIDDAERRLREVRKLAAQANDIMRQALCDLWEKEIALRRTRWAGAGWSIDGAAADDAEVREKALDTLGRRFTAIAQTPSPATFDLFGAQGFAISGTTPNLESHYANLRNERAQVFAESGKSITAEMRESLASKHRMEILEPNVQRDVANRFLDPVTGELYLRLVRAGFADAEGQIAEGERQLVAARDLAIQYRRPRTAAAIEIRLGDHHAFPHGDPRTLGMCLGTESAMRSALTLHRTPEGVRDPAEPAIKIAEGHYEKARGFLLDIGDRSFEAALILREAHLARFRGDGKRADERLKETIREAEAADDTATAAFARGARALLGGERDEYEKAFRAAMEAGDIGTALTLGECAHSWAVRFAEAQLDSWAGLARLQMARNAYREHGFAREEELLAPAEFSIYLALGQTDKSLEIAQRLLAISRRERSEGDGGEEVLRVRMHRLGTLVRAANEAYQREPASELWRQRRDETLAEYAALAESSGDKDQQNLVALQRRSSRTTDLLTKLARTQVTPAFQALYESIRRDAETFDDPRLLMTIDSIAARALPAARERLRVSVEKNSPVEAYRLAAEKVRGAKISFADSMAAQNAWAALGPACQAAVQTEAWPTLKRWLDEMDALSVADPGFASSWKAPLAQFRSHLAVGTGQPREAVRILQELLTVLDQATGPASPREGPRMLQATLALLLSAQIAADLDPWESLHTFVRLEIVNERLREYGTALRKNVRESAELAMLRRRSAFEGGLDTKGARRLGQLEREYLETRTETSTITREALQKSLESPTPSVLFHYVDQRGLIVWLHEPGRGLRVKRVDVVLPEILREVDRLYSLLQDRFPGWEEPAERLHEWLIAPLAPAPTTKRLLVAGAFTGLPFDLLKPHGGPSLVEKIAVSHLPSLAAFARTSQAASPDGSALVAGINDASLSAAELEADHVAGIFGVTPLLGAQVKRAAILRSLPQARWIFFAGHASMDRSNPYLSSLRAADGPLAAWELFQAAPQPELIVLSACETGGASYGAGLDFTNSSLTSFAAAGGAKWTMGSLWLAPDGDTREVIEEFCRGLRAEHLSVDEALRRAKQKSASKGRHPFYYGHLSLLAGGCDSFAAP
jgi:CHAT domain-containing protein